MEELQLENMHLASGVERQRDQVETLVSGLEKVIKDLDGANGVMAEVLRDGEIARHARELDGEIVGREKELESRL